MNWTSLSNLPTLSPSWLRVGTAEELLAFSQEILPRKEKSIYKGSLDLAVNGEDCTYPRVHKSELGYFRVGFPGFQSTGQFSPV